MSGIRVGSYLHQDGLRGGALVKVTTQTDFSSRTDDVKDFVQKVAQLAFGAQTEDANAMFEVFPNLKEDLDALAKKIKEDITIAEIRILK